MVFFAIIVPSTPYSPECNFRAIEGKLSDAFLEAVRRAMSARRVPFLQIGDVILLPFPEWCCNGDRLREVRNKAVESLLYEKYGADPDAIPEHVEAFRIGELGFNRYNCNLIRAVAIEWETGPQEGAKRLHPYAPEARPSEVCVRTPSGWRVPTLKELEKYYPRGLMFDWEKEQFAVCR